MGILSRIKKRLPIVGGNRDPRPSEAWTPPVPKEPSQAAPPPPPRPAPREPEEVRGEIEHDVGSHAIVLYMKGSAQAPQCGFSAAVVDILQQLSVPFETRDVSSDPVLRQVIKDFSDWPTLPQLYLAGEFIGGCDIVREMHEKGELKEAVDKALQGPS